MTKAERAERYKETWRSAQERWLVAHGFRSTRSLLWWCGGVGVELHQGVYAYSGSFTAYGATAKRALQALVLTIQDAEKRALAGRLAVETVLSNANNPSN